MLQRSACMYLTTFRTVFCNAYTAQGTAHIRTTNHSCHDLVQCTFYAAILEEELYELHPYWITIFWVELKLLKPN